MPCPAYQIHRGDHRTQEYRGLKGDGVVYGVAHLEKKKKMYSLETICRQMVVVYKSRVDPLANTSIKPTLYRTVISSEARHEMRINQLTKLVYRAAGIIGDPGIGEIDHDR